jgi:hypothetical protein
MSSKNIYTSNNFYLDYVCTIALENKYTKWYFNIIDKALKRNLNKKEAKLLFGYTEGHHIYPNSFKKINYDSKNENIVFLTSKEHFVVHALLVKMFINIYRYKMINAFLRMKTINNKALPNRYFNSNLYSKFKKYFSERFSWSAKRQKRTKNLKHCYNPKTLERTRIEKIDQLPKGWIMGCPLNTKGMISICNFETKETRRIRPDQQIPKGWVKGNFNAKNNKNVKGLIYIHDPILKIRKRVKPDSIIPEGFILGYGKKSW